MTDHNQTPARFLIWSDLHDEFWDGFVLPEIDGPIDGVLIAGDTHTRGRHLEIPARAARKYGCPVVVIWGNHELYGSFWNELRADENAQIAALRAEGLDIRVLNRGVTEIAGVRIIGATLWTNLQNFPEHVDLAAHVVKNLLADFRLIWRDYGRQFTIEDMLLEHDLDQQAIFSALQEPYPGPTIVMTHHIPLCEMIHPKRLNGNLMNDLSTNGFVSDLWDEIRDHNIDSWICGHSHDASERVMEGRYGPIRFVMNQRGYPEEDCVFDPRRVLEVRR